MPVSFYLRSKDEEVWGEGGDYCRRLKMLLRDESVEETPGVEEFTWKDLPAAAFAAAVARAEVSIEANDLSPLMTADALELLTRLEDPLISPEVNWSTKVLDALVSELAPIRILPRLMRVPRSDRSRLPPAMMILYRAERAEPVLEPVEAASDEEDVPLKIEQEERRTTVAKAAAMCFSAFMVLYMLTVCSYLQI